ALPCVSGDREAYARLEDALHEARVFTAAFCHRAELSRTHRDLEQLKVMKSALCSAMFGSGAELSRVAAMHLPSLGLEACVVAELFEPSKPEAQARVLFGYGPGGKLASQETIALGALLTHSLLERSGRTQILMPIV